MRYHHKASLLMCCLLPIAVGCAESCAQQNPCKDDIDCGQQEICGEDSLCRDAKGQRHDIEIAGSHLIYRNDLGTINLYRADGSWLMRNATSRVTTDSLGDFDRLFSIVRSKQRSVKTSSQTDILGQAKRLHITSKGGPQEPQLQWTISGYQQGFYTFRVTVHNTTAEQLQLAKAMTLVAPENGGLFLGADPTAHRILDNGSYVYKDHVVQVTPGDVAKSDFLASLIPGKFAGHSVSNWNHCVKDLESDTVWLAGSLSFASTSPVFNLTFEEDRAIKSPDGRLGFTLFSADCAYQPELKPIEPGAVFSSELTYIHPSETNPFEALENYASRVKTNLGITLWQDKAEGNTIPNGWNSWSGSGGTGGYGTDINEQVILENCDVMAEELRDWGIDWFQVDDGYEPAYGDWVWRQDRFPHGPRWLSDQIRQRGFKPGLWIAPFTLDPNAQTVAEHPEWMADKSTMGSLLANNYELLDLTHPEVKQWIRELFRKFRQDWNYDWLKMDFSYWALLGTHFSQPDKTREEAYREAIGIVREEIGDETFFLSVSALGAHYGLVDSDRITMDSAPIWDWDPDIADNDPLNQQGLKPTVRTSSRRYYLHNRIWINHPDLIIFRSNPHQPNWPRVTLQEAQAFCTYVGLSGGIVKLGDKLVDLTADQINSIRALLPIYGQSARPLDLFTREFAELWHLPIRQTRDGYSEPYEIVGLIHWGLNWDMSTNPYTVMEDEGADRQFDIPLETLGVDPARTYHAYEFWTQTYIGEVTKRLTTSVPSHTAHVIALREKQDRPQFLGWNRNFTMGATDIRSIQWQQSTNTLTVKTKIARSTHRAPFRYELAFFVPSNYDVTATSVIGARTRGTQSQMDGRILRVSFAPEQTGHVIIEITF